METPERHIQIHHQQFEPRQQFIMSGLETHHISDENLRSQEPSVRHLQPSSTETMPSQQRSKSQNDKTNKELESRIEEVQQRVESSSQISSHLGEPIVKSMGGDEIFDVIPKDLVVSSLVETSVSSNTDKQKKKKKAKKNKKDTIEIDRALTEIGNLEITNTVVRTVIEPSDTVKEDEVITTLTKNSKSKEETKVEVPEGSSNKKKSKGKPTQRDASSEAVVTETVTLEKRESPPKTNKIILITHEEVRLTPVLTFKMEFPDQSIEEWETTKRDVTFSEPPSLESTATDSGVNSTDTISEEIELEHVIFGSVKERPSMRITHDDHVTCENVTEQTQLSIAKLEVDTVTEMEIERGTIVDKPFDGKSHKKHRKHKAKKGEVTETVTEVEIKTQQIESHLDDVTERQQEIETPETSHKKKKKNKKTPCDATKVDEIPPEQSERVVASTVPTVVSKKKKKGKKQNAAESQILDVPMSTETNKEKRKKSSRAKSVSFEEAPQIINTEVIQSGQKPKDEVEGETVEQVKRADGEKVFSDEEITESRVEYRGLPIDDATDSWMDASLVETECETHTKEQVVIIESPKVVVDVKKTVEYKGLPLDNTSDLWMDSEIVISDEEVPYNVQVEEQTAPTQEIGNMQPVEETGHTDEEVTPSACRRFVLVMPMPQPEIIEATIAESNDVVKYVDPALNTAENSGTPQAEERRVDYKGLPLDDTSDLWMDSEIVLSDDETGLSSLMPEDIVKSTSEMNLEDKSQMMEQHKELLNKVTEQLTTITVTSEPNLTMTEDQNIQRVKEKSADYKGLPLDDTSDLWMDSEIVLSDDETEVPSLLEERVKPETSKPKPEELNIQIVEDVTEQRITHTRTSEPQQHDLIAVEHKIEYQNLPQVEEKKVDYKGLPLDDTCDLWMDSEIVLSDDENEVSSLVEERVKPETSKAKLEELNIQVVEEVTEQRITPTRTSEPQQHDLIVVEHKIEDQNPPQVEEKKVDYKGLPLDDTSDLWMDSEIVFSDDETEVSSLVEVIPEKSSFKVKIQVMEDESPTKVIEQQIIIADTSEPQQHDVSAIEQNIEDGDILKEYEIVEHADIATITDSQITTETAVQTKQYTPKEKNFRDFDFQLKKREQAPIVVEHYYELIPNYNSCLFRDVERKRCEELSKNETPDSSAPDIPLDIQPLYLSKVDLSELTLDTSETEKFAKPDVRILGLLSEVPHFDTLALRAAEDEWYETKSVDVQQTQPLNLKELALLGLQSEVSIHNTISLYEAEMMWELNKIEKVHEELESPVQTTETERPFHSNLNPNAKIFVPGGRLQFTTTYTTYQSEPTEEGHMWNQPDDTIFEIAQDHGNNVWVLEKPTLEDPMESTDEHPPTKTLSEIPKEEVVTSQEPKPEQEKSATPPRQSAWEQDGSNRQFSDESTDQDHREKVYIFSQTTHKSKIFNDDFGESIEIPPDHDSIRWVDSMLDEPTDELIPDVDETIATTASKDHSQTSPLNIQKPKRSHKSKSPRRKSREQKIPPCDELPPTVWEPRDDAKTFAKVVESSTKEESGETPTPDDTELIYEIDVRLSLNDEPTDDGTRNVWSEHDTPSKESTETKFRSYADIAATDRTPVPSEPITPMKRAKEPTQIRIEVVEEKHTEHQAPTPEQVEEAVEKPVREALVVPKKDKRKSSRSKKSEKDLPQHTRDLDQEPSVEDIVQIVQQTTELIIEHVDAPIIEDNVVQEAPTLISEESKKDTMVPDLNEPIPEATSRLKKHSRSKKKVEAKEVGEAAEEPVSDDHLVVQKNDRSERPRSEKYEKNLPQDTRDGDQVPLIEDLVEIVQQATKVIIENVDAPITEYSVVQESPTLISEEPGKLVEATSIEETQLRGEEPKDSVSTSPKKERKKDLRSKKKDEKEKPHSPKQQVVDALENERDTEVVSAANVQEIVATTAADSTENKLEQNEDNYEKTETFSVTVDEVEPERKDDSVANISESITIPLSSPVKQKRSKKKKRNDEDKQEEGSEVVIAIHAHEKPITPIVQREVVEGTPISAKSDILELSETVVVTQVYIPHQPQEHQEIVTSKEEGGRESNSLQMTYTDKTPAFRIECVVTESVSHIESSIESPKRQERADFKTKVLEEPRDSVVEDRDINQSPVEILETVTTDVPVNEEETDKNGDQIPTEDALVLITEKPKKTRRKIKPIDQPIVEAFSQIQGNVITYANIAATKRPEKLQIEEVIHQQTPTTEHVEIRIEVVGDDRIRNEPLPMDSEGFIEMISRKQRRSRSRSLNKAQEEVEELPMEEEVDENVTLKPETQKKKRSRSRRNKKKTVDKNELCADVQSEEGDEVAPQHTETVEIKSDSPTESDDLTVFDSRRADEQELENIALTSEVPKKKQPRPRRKKEKDSYEQELELHILESVGLTPVIKYIEMEKVYDDDVFEREGTVAMPQEVDPLQQNEGRTLLSHTEIGVEEVDSTSYVTPTTKTPKKKRSRSRRKKEKADEEAQFQSSNESDISTKPDLQSPDKEVHVTCTEQIVVSLEEQVDKLRNVVDDLKSESCEPMQPDEEVHVEVSVHPTVEQVEDLFLATETPKKKRSRSRRKKEKVTEEPSNESVILPQPELIPVLRSPEKEVHIICTDEIIVSTEEQIDKLETVTDDLKPESCAPMLPDEEVDVEISIQPIVEQAEDIIVTTETSTKKRPRSHRKKENISDEPTEENIREDMEVLSEQKSNQLHIIRTEELSEEQSPTETTNERQFSAKLKEEENTGPRQLSPTHPDEVAVFSLEEQIVSVSEPKTPKKKRSRSRRKKDSEKSEPDKESHITYIEELIAQRRVGGAPEFQNIPIMAPKEQPQDKESVQPGLHIPLSQNSVPESVDDKQAHFTYADIAATHKIVKSVEKEEVIHQVHQREPVHIRIEVVGQPVVQHEPLSTDAEGFTEFLTKRERRSRSRSRTKSEEVAPREQPSEEASKSRHSEERATKITNKTVFEELRNEVVQINDEEEIFLTPDEEVSQITQSKEQAAPKKSKKIKSKKVREELRKEAIQIDDKEKELPVREPEPDDEASKSPKGKEEATPKKSKKMKDKKGIEQPEDDEEKDKASPNQRDEDDKKSSKKKKKQNKSKEEKGGIIGMFSSVKNALKKHSGSTTPENVTSPAKINTSVEILLQPPELSETSSTTISLKPSTDLDAFLVNERSVSLPDHATSVVEKKSSFFGSLLSKVTGSKHDTAQKKKDEPSKKKRKSISDTDDDRGVFETIRAKVVDALRRKSVSTVDQNQNLKEDGPFWLDKHIYTDAEEWYQIYLAQLNKANVVQGGVALTGDDPRDKDGDSDSSSGRSSPKPPQPDQTSNFPQANTQIASADLPGGMCRWKDESTYLSELLEDSPKYDILSLLKAESDWNEKKAIVQTSDSECFDYLNATQILSESVAENIIKDTDDLDSYNEPFPTLGPFVRTISSRFPMEEADDNSNDFNISIKKVKCGCVFLGSLCATNHTMLLVK
ncbi:hypothetical protein RI129_006857 [Pyrocoelia pectoralis]|uniref:Uncharacterized protein n=1 Tax=Pyrocoelia pectoralis TaxID=417401 RepID=A0AAN7ZIW3_9COLE